MANDSDFYVFGALARLKVEFADEVNLAGGEDHSSDFDYSISVKHVNRDSLSDGSK